MGIPADVTQRDQDVQQILFIIGLIDNRFQDHQAIGQQIQEHVLRLLAVAHDEGQNSLQILNPSNSENTLQTEIWILIFLLSMHCLKILKISLEIGNTS